MNLSDVPFNRPDAHTYGYQPRELMKEVGKVPKDIIIGIPKDKNPYEYRVPLTPQAVELLVANGLKVIIESNAGTDSNYPDDQYLKAGAIVVANAIEIYKQSHIVVKISPPDFSELELMTEKQTLLSTLNIATRSREYIASLMSKRITAVGFEFIKDDKDNYPIVRSMSEIAGSVAITIAANYLSKSLGGKGVLLGGIVGISPAEVVILGAGTTGEYAAKAAMALGAQIKVFDNSISKLHELQRSLGAPIFTSVYHPQVMEKAMRSADVIIGALSLDNSSGWFMISEEMVKTMKPGSVIVDMSVDNGACFETSELTNLGKPTFIKHGVIHYCVPNLASTVSRTASIAISNVLTPILSETGYCGGVFSEIQINHGVRAGVYIFQGILTNAIVAKKFKLPSQNIDLLMATF
ncbi:MAG TPA: alanine dehydrogenase [Bacteroidales bacterium]|nr:alanine dehydrogenase [Bacteroidales bacterium]